MHWLSAKFTSTIFARSPLYAPPRMRTHDPILMFDTFFFVTVTDSTISAMGTSLIGFEWYTCRSPASAFLTWSSRSASTYT